MDNFKKLITSVLTSSKTQSTVERINEEYKELIGENIPYKELGFNSMEELLQSIPDVVQVCNSSTVSTIRLVSSEKSAHVRKLVKKQVWGQNKKNHRNFNRTPAVNNAEKKTNDINNAESSRSQEINKPKEMKFNEFAEQITDLRARNAELSTQKEALVKRNEAIEKKNIELQKQNADLASEKSNIETENAELQNRLAESQTKMAELEKQKDTLKQQNDNLCTQLEKLESLKWNLEMENVQLESQTMELAKQKNTWQLQNLELIKDKDEITKRNAKLVVENDDLERRNKILEKQNEDMRKQIEEIEDKEPEKKTDNGHFENHVCCEGVVTEIKYLKELIDETKDKNTILQQTKDLLMQRLRQMESEELCSKSSRKELPRNDHSKRETGWKWIDFANESLSKDSNESPENDRKEKHWNGNQASQKYVWLHIYNVEESIGVERVKKYIGRYLGGNSDDIEVKELPTMPKNGFKSFVVRVPSTKKRIICDKKFWPSEVGMKNFDFHRYRNFVNKDKYFYSQC